MGFVRYGIPALLVLAGVVCLFAAPEGSGAEGFALFTGAGLSVLLLNALFRIGVSGDAERDREDRAREHFAEHGTWPADERPARRPWRQPENIATPESEAAERRRSGN
ncbi:MAG: hypothetical protein JW895_08360 [Thermoleophilaceae bacterium]|nr:hypothetical protein [Thermoleophilaceae bacterium]